MKTCIYIPRIILSSLFPWLGWFLLQFIILLKKRNKPKTFGVLPHFDVVTLSYIIITAYQSLGSLPASTEIKVPIHDVMH